DRRHYDEPPRDTSTFSLPRDWGSRWMPLTWVSYSPDLGVFAGAGADGTGYDFRRLPYNSHVRVRAGYATAAQTYRAEFTGEFRGVVPPVIVRLPVRVAGRKVWGTYPYYEAAYIGGDSTVRGFVEHRFAGDAAVFGNVELRLSLARFFVLVPGRLGIFGLGDAGRVYVSGQTSDR